MQSDGVLRAIAGVPAESHFPACLSIFRREEEPVRCVDGSQRKIRLVYLAQKAHHGLFVPRVTMQADNERGLCWAFPWVGQIEVIIGGAARDQFSFHKIKLSLKSIQAIAALCGMNSSSSPRRSRK